MNQNMAGINPTGMNEDEINLSSLLDSLWLDRKMVGLIAVAILALGTAYAFMAKPIYQANLIVQVEDSPGSTRSLLGEAGALFDTKTAASAEMELLRSRMVVANAVDSLGLYIGAQPKYFPFVGRWWASRSKQLSNPGILGYGGYAWGNEAIEVPVFNLPQELQEHEFILIAGDNGEFELQQSDHDIALKGKTGQTAVQQTPAGKVEILVTKLAANPGTQFLLWRNSRLKAIESMQTGLQIAEKGKLSGIIEVKLEGGDPLLNAKILNAVGHEYIRQNIDRKSEEAEKTIIFLDSHLPEIKRNVEEAETRYNQLRDKRGTIDIGEEAKNILQQAVGIEVKLLDLKRVREELLSKFTPQHPSVVNADKQLQILNSQKAAIQEQIKRLPGVEQDVISSMRDVKVGTELYTSLLNTAQQLRLAKASKIGTSRMIDEAVVPEQPVKPQRRMIILISAFLGLLAGVMAAFIRKAMRGAIDSPKMIEDATGLQVYATVLESKQQEALSRKIQARETGQFILADTHPDDLSIESLRSFRVALQFAMLDAANNRVMITGPTPGVGKTFLAANMAAILAQAGKRVLLVDMDLHKGHLNQYFGLGRTGGLSEILAGEITLEQATHKEVLKNLSFIANGTLVANPSALFLNERLPQFLEQCSRQYDIVIVDACPALLVSDVAVIGPNMGTTFMVVRDGVSTLADLTTAVKRLGQARVEVKGVLFNGQLQRVSSRYGYGYGYGYKYGSYKQGAKPDNQS
ncbi:MAG: tyrosine protein kinase [Gallionellales bacterium RIFCSPLOWO2_02_FULL_57_47]|nr:MAG: tyrosine protein kinase [Gallionellales bacterium RIFCSPLOWO2_02_FULL_57_47]OGT12119.1 MAG: tyrosine protein kinase [Gallionellales bacterium RIFCSPHIGHO2_02_FULL_57_16]